MMTESPSLMKHLLRAALFSVLLPAPAFAQDVAVATVRRFPGGSSMKRFRLSSSSRAESSPWRNAEPFSIR